MKNTTYLPTGRILLAVVSLGLGLFTATGLCADAKAADAAAAKAPALPVTTAVEKGEPGENGGPFVLKVTNSSKTTLHVSAVIVWSVASHNRANTIKMPAHELAAGASWAISDLAANDHVTLSAEGHAPLEVKVTPPAAAK